MELLHHPMPQDLDLSSLFPVRILCGAGDILVCLTWCYGDGEYLQHRSDFGITYRSLTHAEHHSHSGQGLKMTRNLRCTQCAMHNEGPCSRRTSTSLTIHPPGLKIPTETPALIPLSHDQAPSPIHRASTANNCTPSYSSRPEAVTQESPNATFHKK